MNIRDVWGRYNETMTDGDEHEHHAIVISAQILSFSSMFGPFEELPSNDILSWLLCPKKDGRMIMF